MKKYLFPLILILIMIVSCGKEQDPFLISKKSVGLLNGKKKQVFARF